MPAPHLLLATSDAVGVLRMAVGLVRLPKVCEQMAETSGEVFKIRDTGLNYLLGRWVIPKAEFDRMSAEASGFTRPAR